MFKISLFKRLVFIVLPIFFISNLSLAGVRFNPFTGKQDFTGADIQKTDCSTETQEGRICWDTDDDELYIGDGTTAIQIGGTTSEWTDTGTVIHPTELTDDVSLGSATLINSSKFSLDGDDDQVQVTIQGNATQTDSILIIEDSAGTELINFNNDGRIRLLDDAGSGGNINLIHNGSNGFIQTTVGSFVLNAKNGKQSYQHDGVTGFNFVVEDDLDQVVLAAEDQAGNQLILANDSVSGKDFDHATPTDPTLFIHSDKDPDTDNTEYLALYHDQTDAKIDVGKGNLSINTNVSATSFVTGELIDADGDTKVDVEEGADDDTFRVDTAGTERLTIDSTGLMTYTHAANSDAVIFNFDGILDLGNTNPFFITHDTGASDVTASFTDPFVYIYTERRIDGTNTTTVADDYDNLHVSRHVVCDDCVGSSIDGAVIFANVVTEAGGANNTKILELDHDADSTGDVIQALHRGNGLVMDIDSLATTADVIDIVAGTTSGAVLDITANSTTTGNIIDITANGITAGAQLNFSSTSKDWSTGQFWKMNHTTTNNLTAKSINYIEAKADRTHNAASVLSDNYDLALFHRETDINNAGGTFNAAGSVVKIENRALETAGTLADTVIALEIAQDDNSTGDAIEITHLGNGKSIEILADFATTTADVIDVSADTLTTGDALKLASTSNAVTTGFRMIDSQALGTAITADLGGAEAVNLFKVQRTNTAAAARSDNYDVMSIERNTNNTNAGGSNTQAGSVLNLLNSVSQDAGTTNDSVDVLTITQDSDSSGDGINIAMNAAAGSALDIDHDHATVPAIIVDGETTTGTGVQLAYDALTTGQALRVISNSADANVRTVVQLTNDHVDADSARVLSIQQDGDADAIEIDQNGNGVGIDIQSAATTADVVDFNTTALTTGNAIDMSSLNNLTTGRALNIYSGSNDASARNLVNIYNDAGGDNATVMYLRQDGDHNTLTLDNNSGLSTALNIDSESTTVSTVEIDSVNTTGNVINMTASSLTTGAGVRVYSDSADVSERNLYSAVQDNAAAVGARGLYVGQDSTADGIEIDMNGDGVGLHILHDTNQVNGTGIEIDNPDISEFDQASAMEIVYGTDVEVDATHAANVSFTDPLIYVQTYRNYDAGFNATDNYDMLHIDRQEELSGGTSTSAGSVAEFILDVQDSITTTADVLQLVNESPNANNTGRSLFINNDVVGNTVMLVDAETTTGNIIDVQTDQLTTGKGMVFNPDSLTTGEVIHINSTSSQELTQARPIRIDLDSTTPVTASYSDADAAVIATTITRDYNDGTFTASDSFDVMQLTKIANLNGGGATHTVAGSVLKLTDDVESGIGTVNTKVLEITSDVDSTGPTIDIEARSTGNGITIAYENGTTNNGIDLAANALTTGHGIEIQFDSSVMTTGTALKIRDTEGAADHTALEFQDEFILAIDAEGNGSSGFRADGSTGGSIMLRDTDDAGWTECFALNGVLSCTIDADGVPDGA